jgi:aldose 1-epimerase
VTLAYHVHPQPGYPFTLALEVDYRLDAHGLTVTSRATKVGANAAPFGTAFHPT